MLGNDISYILRKSVYVRVYIFCKNLGDKRLTERF